MTLKLLIALMATAAAVTGLTRTFDTRGRFVLTNGNGTLDLFGRNRFKMVHNGLEQVGSVRRKFLQVHFQGEDGFHRVFRLRRNKGGFALVTRTPDGLSRLPFVRFSGAMPVLEGSLTPVETDVVNLAGMVSASVPGLES